MSDLGLTGPTGEIAAAHRVYMNKVNAFVVSVRLEDSTYLDLAFEPHSAAHDRLVGALTGVATQALSNLGEGGVVIVGMTPAPDDTESEQP